MRTPLATLLPRLPRALQICRIWALVLGFLATSLSTNDAHADLGPFWRQQGEKPGPWMFNLKTGGAFSVFAGDTYKAYYYNVLPNLFTIQMEAGFALDSKRNAYLLLPPTFELAGGYSFVLLPFGFQYDIEMPLRGLYIYPRAQAGFGALICHGYCNRNYTALTGFFAPEFGVKYVLKGRLNFGGELFSLPIFFNGDGVIVQYRVLLYAGINI